MAEYINRERARFEAKRYFKNMGEIQEDLDMLFCMLPAENVSPVRHGRWILEREPDGKPYCFHCSVCDDDFHYIGIVTASDYCPNCGAKMDGDKNE